MLLDVVLRSIGGLVGTAAQAKRNKAACRALAERAALLEIPLRQLALTGDHEEALVSLDRTLREAAQLVRDVNGRGKVEAWRKAGETARMFDLLHEKLSHSASALQLGMMVCFTAAGERANRLEDHVQDLEVELKSAKHEASSTSELRQVVEELQRLVIDKRAESVTLTRKLVHQRGAAGTCREIRPADLDPSPANAYARVSDDVFLGEGGFATVYRAEMDGQVHVAVKCLRGRQMSDRARRELMREADVMASIRSPYVVQVYGIISTSEPLCIVMELVQGKSLRRLIDSDEGRDMSVMRRLRLGAGVALGLQELHKVGMLHRDVKAQNVMVDERTGGVKLIDFGLARGRDETLSQTARSMSMSGGSLPWMPPEMVEEEVPPTLAADVYMLGMTLYEIMSGELPVPAGTTQPQILRRIIRGERPDIRGVPGCPHTVAQVIERCWSANPRERPAVADVAATLRDAIAQAPAQSRPTFTVTRIDLRKPPQPRPVQHVVEPVPLPPYQLIDNGVPVPVPEIAPEDDPNRIPLPAFDTWNLPPDHGQWMKDAVPYGPDSQWAEGRRLFADHLRDTGRL